MCMKYMPETKPNLGVYETKDNQKTESLWLKVTTLRYELWLSSGLTNRLIEDKHESWHMEEKLAPSTWKYNRTYLCLSSYSVLTSTRTFLLKDKKPEVTFRTFCLVFLFPFIWRVRCRSLCPNSNEVGLFRSPFLESGTRIFLGPQFLLINGR